MDRIILPSHWNAIYVDGKWHIYQPYEGKFVYSDYSKDTAYAYAAELTGNKFPVVITPARHIELEDLWRKVYAKHSGNP